MSRCSGQARRHITNRSFIQKNKANRSDGCYTEDVELIDVDVLLRRFAKGTSPATVLKLKHRKRSEAFRAVFAVICLKWLWGLVLPNFLKNS